MKETWKPGYTDGAWAGYKDQPQDGENFTQAASLAVPEETASSADGVKSFTVDFLQTEARYLRVGANTVTPILYWLGARGEKSHMFIGEISVE